MSERTISRTQFLQVVAALAGTQLLGCDGGTGPATPDSGGGGNQDAGGGGGTDAGGGGGTDAGGTQDTDAGGTPGEDGGTTENMCSGAMIVAVVNNNHPPNGAGEPQGHELSIPVADIIAGAGGPYTTTGPAEHTHPVTLTADDYATLRAGGTVRVYSCSGQEHEYVLTCATVSGENQDPEAVCDTL